MRYSYKGKLSMINISILKNNFVKRDSYNKLIAEVIDVYRSHEPLAFIMILYVCILGMIALLLNMVDRISLSFYANMILYRNSILVALTLFFSAFIIGYPICIMLFVRPRKLIKYILNDILINYLKKERLMNALFIILSIIIFGSTFTTFKTFIPFINPYSWDPIFVKIDTTIHGGYHPWQLLQPVVGYPLWTSVINIFYHLWYFVLYFVLFWQAFSLRDTKLRLQFFISFVLLWAILGTFFAIMFSSVGPCFYDKIAIGNDIYKPLMNYLNTANESFPVWSLASQKELWYNYENNQLIFGGGISAMPSIHVATSMLFALVGWRYHHILGIAFGIYAFIIMIGSVHLAWHYAIDGYFSIIVTVLVWHIVGYFLGRKTNIHKYRNAAKN
jgi:hypothetical protein